MVNKSLGQHWLHSRGLLENIAAQASIQPSDTVLEIGPGLGTLTSVLLGQAKKVIAVEFDSQLARKLPAQFPGKNLEVVSGDILSFDLNSLPKDYKVVANLPYYITSKIIQTLLTSANPPETSVLLVQKEVACRLAAKSGEMSLLSLSAQIFATISLGEVIAAQCFTPPPKVDSQVVILRRRSRPVVPLPNQKNFFRVVRAGFSQRRKKLKTALSAGLRVDKSLIEELLLACSIAADVRAQDLSLSDWQQLCAKIEQ